MGALGGAEDAELFQEAAIGVVAVASLTRPHFGVQVKAGWRALLKLDEIDVRNVVVPEDVSSGFADAAFQLSAHNVFPFHTSSPLLVPIQLVQAVRSWGTQRERGIPDDRRGHR